MGNDAQETSLEENASGLVICCHVTQARQEELEQIPLLPHGSGGSAEFNQKGEESVDLSCQGQTVLC